MKPGLPFVCAIVYVATLVLGFFHIHRRAEQRGLSAPAKTLYAKQPWWLLPTDREKFYFRAARTLPANHRLIETDLLVADASESAPPFWLPVSGEMVGKYVLKAVPLGSVVLAENLVDKPRLSLTDTDALMLFDVAKQPLLAQTLEPGDAVKIYRSSTNLIMERIQILALGGSAATNSTVFLRIPRDQVFLISTQKQDELYLVPYSAR